MIWLLTMMGCLGQTDEDGDGVTTLTDCDDTNADVYPGAEETCDGLDNDCDGTADDNPPEGEGLLLYRDADEDGYGSDDTTQWGCESELGWAEVGGDCADTNPEYGPHADEFCDSVDNDCDGEIDEDAFDVILRWPDSDGDGYGSGEQDSACPNDTAFADQADDCNDSDAEISPAADEICDSLDNNCDGEVDEDDAIDALTVYDDDDGDTYGDESTAATACEPPEGTVLDGTDCDDADFDINPGAAEVCDDGVDNNCSGTADDDDSTLDLSTATTWGPDTDGDGFADEANAQQGCTQPEGMIEGATDCDDRDAYTFPGAASNDSTTDCLTDQDTDGYGSITSGGTDCDDAASDTFPGAAPEDSTTDCLADLDGDDYGSIKSGGTDCDDLDVDTNPGATEVCDGGHDNNCDGYADDDDANLDLTTLTTFAPDDDGDGFGSEYETYDYCEAPSGLIEDTTDCNDDSDQTFPGAAPNDSATECLEDIDDDDYGSTAFGTTGTDCDDENHYTFPGAAPNDSTTECLTDVDGDGYGDVDGFFEGTDCDDTDASVNIDATEVCDDDIDNDCDDEVDNASECATGCTEIDAAGLPDGAYTIDPPGPLSALEVTCEAGKLLVDTDLLLDNTGWMVFTEEVSNFASWSASSYTGYTADGFWIETVRNTSYNGYSMCVDGTMTLPWSFEAIEGSFDADGYVNGSPDDNDGLGWGSAANSLGEGHVMFGVYYGSGSYETIKDSDEWGSDFGAQSFTFSSTALTSDSTIIVWEYCDDGLRGEDLLIENIELWITDVP